MANWKKTVNVANLIRQYQRDDVEDIDVAAYAAAILKLLEKELPEYEHYLQDIANDKDSPEWHELEYELDQLYDYADANLIWMGI